MGTSAQLVTGSDLRGLYLGFAAFEQLMQGASTASMEIFVAKVAERCSHISFYHHTFRSWIQ